MSLLKTKKSGKTILGAEDGVKDQSYCDLLFYVDATPEVLLTILKGRLFPMKVIKKNPNPMKMKMLPATLAFEDIWPSGGDYDMNDVIVEYNAKSISTKEYSNEDR